MRTTVTLEEDVAVRLREAARTRGISFKAVINEAIRAGLAEPPDARPFRVEARPLGLRAGIDLTKANALAAQLEDDELIDRMKRGT
jgi:hypothetical protein